MSGLDLYEQIDALMDIEAYDEVVSRLNEEGVLDGNDFLLNWDLGWAYFKLNQFDRSIAPLKRAVKLEPSQFASHFALGVALEGLARLEEAESSLRAAVVLRDSSVARQALAVVLMEKGDFAAAERIHVEGLEANPNSAARWEGYADFLHDTGREKEADAAREKASTFAPERKDSELDEFGNGED